MAAKGEIVQKLFELSDNELKEAVRDINHQYYKNFMQKPGIIFDWDQYFMSIACLAALASEDKNSPVGACIVSPNKTVVGIGYNAMPNKHEPNDKEFPTKGREDDDFQNAHYDVDRKFLYIVHAAVNAIINKTIPSLEGCTIYTTMPPDRDCAHAIIQSGIKVVKYAIFHNETEKNPQTELDRTKKPDITDAMQLLQQSDILLIQLEKDKLKEPQVKITITKDTGIEDTVTKVVSLSKRTETKKDDVHVLELPELFMSLALLAAKKQGHHERRHTLTQGACIVDENDKILSIGHSGYPDIVNQKAIERGGDYDGQDHFITHAEYKAILARGVPSFRGCTLYVTKHPCNGCAQVIVQSRIRKVYYNEEGTSKDNTDFVEFAELNRLEKKSQKWKDDARKNMYWASRKILEDTAVITEQWGKIIEVEMAECK